MNLPIFLDITIGLVFLYLLLSLLASEIQEIISALVQWRAKHLRNAILILLGVNNSRPGSKEQQEQFKAAKQKLVEAQKQLKEAQANQQELIEAQAKVKEAQQELQTYEELQAYEDTEKAREILNNLYKHSLIRVLDQKRQVDNKSDGPSYIPSDTFAAALREILKTDLPNWDKLQNNLSALAIEIHESNLPKNLKDDLSTLARRAQKKTTELEKETTKFEKEIADWFDRSMERASGVYRRYNKLLAIIIGFLIAFFSNTNTIYIVNWLSKEHKLASAVSQFVSEKTKNREIDSLGSYLDDKDIDKLSLPIGWKETEWGKIDTSQPVYWWNGIVKFLGWLLTGIAISMGASFWFDILNKFINVRYTGKVPSARLESENEKS